MLGHQGVLGLDLGEGVGHDHQEEVQLLLRQEVRSDSGEEHGLLARSAGCSPTQSQSVQNWTNVRWGVEWGPSTNNNYQGWIFYSCFPACQSKK